MNKISNDVSINLAQEFIDSLYYQIKLTEKYCKFLAKQLEERYNFEITLDELTAISIINLYNGEIHQRDLARIILKDRANTGRMVSNLEANGYIRRIEKTKNKRQSYMIVLTEKGCNILESMGNIIKPMFVEVHSKMNEVDINYVKNGLKVLRDAMKESVEIQI